MAAPAEFPRPDLPIEQKFKKDENGVYIYAKNAIDFAVVNHYNSRRAHIKKMNELYKKYNGTHIGYAVQYLNKTYGKKNAMKYIDYRLGRPKIEKLIGEFTERPINSTVFTVNKKAQMKKLDNFYLMAGLHSERETVEEIRGKFGEESVANGMPIPPKEVVDNFWANANSKTKNEVVMQYLVDNFTKINRDFLYQLSSCYRDVMIVAETHGKVYINEKGKVCFREIDPRDAIFLENDRDHFCRTSPFHGEKRRMFLHQIIAEFQPDKKTVDKLVAEGNTSEYAYDDSYERINVDESSNERSYWVYTIQWKAYDPIITKISPAKNKVLPTTDYNVDIPVATYLRDKEKIEKDLAKGKYGIEIKYKETIWEITRVGQDTYFNGGPKKNIMGSYDSPFETKFEYIHYLCNTVNGVRISIKELLDAIEEQYNIVRFQINRELAKMKGMTLAYDRAFLPKKRTVKEVLYQIINDGFLDYDSSEDGNISGETKDPKDAIRAIDLGASASLQSLVMLAQNLEATAETISGISNQRIGDIKASETATNAQSAISSSKTITEPINIGYDIFITDIINLVMEQSKVAALINPNWAETVVGKDGVKFLEISQNISQDDFGAYLQDYRKEKQVRDKAMLRADQAINAGTLTVEDAMMAEQEETIAGAIAVLKAGTQTIRDIAAKQQQQEAELQKEQMANAREMAMEDREDKQTAKISEIKAKGLVDLAVKTAEAANKNVIEKNKGKKK